MMPSARNRPYGLGLRGRSGCAGGGGSCHGLGRTDMCCRPSRATGDLARPSRSVKPALDPLLVAWHSVPSARSGQRHVVLPSRPCSTNDARSWTAFNGTEVPCSPGAPTSSDQIAQIGDDRGLSRPARRKRPSYCRLPPTGGRAQGSRPRGFFAAKMASAIRVRRGLGVNLLNAAQRDFLAPAMKPRSPRQVGRRAKHGRTLAFVTSLDQARSGDVSRS